MSFETDLAKFKKQVDSFAIAGAAGNFYTGFSIGDDARGAGAGVGGANPNTPEEVLTHLENSFKSFEIRGGHDISVAGSLVGGGFAISAKQVQSGEGTSGGGVGPTSTGACCIGTECFVLTSDDCATMSGLYRGDDVVCIPNPCTGACCHADGTCFITTEAGCVGTYQGAGTDCEPNPCPIPPCCCGKTHVTLSADVSIVKHCASGPTISVSATIPEQTFAFDCTGISDYINTFIEDSFLATVTCDPDCDPGTYSECRKLAHLSASISIECVDAFNISIGSNFSTDFVLRCNNPPDSECFWDWSFFTVGMGTAPILFSCAELASSFDLVGNASDSDPEATGTVTVHVTFS